MGYKRGSSSKRYRIVPPEGVSGLLEPWRRRLPTFECLVGARDYALRVFNLGMSIDDVRPVRVFLGDTEVGKVTETSGWTLS